MNLIFERPEIPPNHYRMALTVGDHSPYFMRSIVRTLLRRWEMPELAGTVELVLSELVTNVHRHVPDRWCRTTLFRTDTGVRLEVRDRSPEFPVCGTPTEWDEAGRGLSLVTRLADKYEVVPEETGKTVRCEINRSLSLVPRQPSP